MITLVIYRFIFFVIGNGTTLHGQLCCHVDGIPSYERVTVFSPHRDLRVREFLLAPFQLYTIGHNDSQTQVSIIS